MIVYIIVLTLIGGIVMFFDGFGSLPKKAKKKRLALFILIILVIITLIISLGVYILLTEPPTTANTMINAFHDDRELFDAVVEELEKFSGVVSVYRDKDDIPSLERHVVEMGSLYFASEEIIEETSLALLYDTVNPVFQKYDIKFLFGVEGEGQFVFEDGWGRRAFLGYSKEDKSQPNMTVVEEVHICEGWYAIVYTD